MTQQRRRCIANARRVLLVVSGPIVVAAANDTPAQEFLGGIPSIWSCSWAARANPHTRRPRVHCRCVCRGVATACGNAVSGAMGRRWNWAVTVAVIIQRQARNNFTLPLNPQESVVEWWRAPPPGPPSAPHRSRAVATDCSHRNHFRSDVPPPRPPDFSCTRPGDTKITPAIGWSHSKKPPRAVAAATSRRHKRPRVPHTGTTAIALTNECGMRHAHPTRWQRVAWSTGSQARASTQNNIRTTSSPQRPPGRESPRHPKTHLQPAPCVPLLTMSSRLSHSTA